MQQLKIVTDQMGREVQLQFPPIRIISLVPSQTELLYYLGLDEEVVGQTLFCIHPEEMHAKKARIGGTKKISFKKIASFKPDLIIGNKEENNQSQVEELMKHYPVWMSDIKTLEDAVDMILKVGDLVDRTEKSNELAASIQDAFARLNKLRNPVSAAYLIWRKPWMAAGGNTFINDMLRRCGFINVFEKENSRYPEVSEESLLKSKPAYILLSSEPYPFKQHHIDELELICPNATIIMVDGEMFSWYGNRLLLAAKYFESI